jgi:hypothetical protein
MLDTAASVAILIITCQVFHIPINIINYINLRLPWMQVALVNCGAVLKVELKKFDNSAGKDWASHGCDRFLLTNKECDHKFYFCLDDSNR